MTVWVHANHNRDGSAKRGNLSERQVDENHAALDDMNAKVGVDAGEDEARDKRRE